MMKNYMKFLAIRFAYFLRIVKFDGFRDVLILSSCDIELWFIIITKNGVRRFERGLSCVCSCVMWCFEPLTVSPVDVNVSFFLGWEIANVSMKFYSPVFFVLISDLLMRQTYIYIRIRTCAHLSFLT